MSYHDVIFKTPMQHQEDIANCPLDGVYDESDTGVGKSVSGLEFMTNRHYVGNGSFFGLVICVKNAVDQFRNEVLGVEAGMPFDITRYRKPHLGLLKAYQAQGINVIMITNKELMNHAGSREYIQQVLDIYQGNGTLILDEAHKYRKSNTVENDDGTRMFKILAVRNAVEVSRMFKYHYLSSATPYDKNVAEKWVAYHILYPDLFKSYEDFKYRYTKIDYWTGKRINNPARMEELHRITAPFTFKYTLDDIRDDVPTQSITMLNIQAPKHVEKLANLIRMNVGEEFTLLVPPRLGAHGEMIAGFGQTMFIDHHFSLDMALKRLGSVHGLKKEWVYDNHPNPTKDNPLLVLCAFKETAQEIASHYGVTALIGGVKITDEIKYGRVLVGTIDALKESISLEHFTRGVLLTPDWSSITLRQIFGRMRRLTSMFDMHLTILVSSIAIDPRIWSVVDGKLKDVALYDAMARRKEEIDDEDTIEFRKTMLENRKTNAVNKVMSKIGIGDVLVKYDCERSLRIFKKALRIAFDGTYYVHRVNFIAQEDMQETGMRWREMKYKVIATLTIKELIDSRG